MVENAEKRIERILTQKDRFDKPSTTERNAPDTPASIALRLGGVAMKFARTERIPRYDDSERESDAEHSFMLALIATELAVMVRPDLDIGLVHQYSTIHDLIELKTKDVLTFGISPEDLAAKEQAEHEALEELIAELPPYTGYLLGRYEQQKDPESRFVRMADKMMPVIVDILGDGVRIMKEDCNVTTSTQLKDERVKMYARIGEKFKEFPELVNALKQLYELFEEESIEAFALAS